MEYVSVSTAEQVSELSQLSGAIFSEYYTSLGIMSEQQSKYMVDMFFSEVAIGKQMSHDGYQYYFLCDKGVKLGFCAVQPQDGKLFLSKLYLSAECRGKGYGRQTIDFVEGLCLGMGLRAVWLTVNRANKHSIGFYQRSGFKILREEDAEIGNGYIMDDYIMELNLR